MWASYCTEFDGCRLAQLIASMVLVQSKSKKDIVNILDPGSDDDDYPVYEFIYRINFSFMFIGCLLIVSEITRIGKEFSLNF